MTHPLWQSIPFFCILLPLFCAAVTSILKKRAGNLALLVLLIETALSVCFVFYMAAYGESYTYTMGHYTAPWGNEIRAGMLEAVTAAVFSFIMLLSALGGSKKV